MDSRPRLTINIEIDEVQSEVLVVSTLNELYLAIDNFFSTYNLSDPLVKKKIKERIVASFRLCQSAQYGVRPSEFNAEAANAFVIKENMKSPAVFQKPQSKFFQTEVKTNHEQTYPAPKLVDETTKNKSMAKMPPLVRHGSMIKPFPKFNPGMQKKRSVVQPKTAMFASKASTRYTPSAGLKTAKTGALSGKGKHLSQIYPKLQGATTVSTFTEFQHEMDPKEIQTQTAINRLTATPKIGMGMTAVDPNEIRYGFPLDYRPTEQTYPNDIHAQIYKEPPKRMKSALCMTERPAKSQILIPPMVDMANRMVYSQESEQVKSWVDLRSKTNVYKDKHHGSSSRPKFEREKSWMRHRPANSDVIGHENGGVPDLFEISSNGIQLYREMTQGASPIKRSNSRNMRPGIYHDERQSHHSLMSPDNTLEKSLDDPGLRYFMKLNFKNESLRGIFDRLDSRKTGLLDQTNINMNPVTSDILANFSPVITYIFENPKKQGFNFNDFLKLVYKFKINF